MSIFENIKKNFVCKIILRILYVIFCRLKLNDIVISWQFRQKLKRKVSPPHAIMHVCSYVFTFTYAWALLWSVQFLVSECVAKYVRSMQNLKHWYYQTYCSISSCVFVRALSEEKTFWEHLLQGMEQQVWIESGGLSFCLGCWNSNLIKQIQIIGSLLGLAVIYKY